jgi:hypothetical protein
VTIATIWRTEENEVTRLALIALAAALIAAATFTSTAAAQESPNASCVAHFVQDAAGPPGLFRSQFGPDFANPFGETVSDVAHREGTTFSECVLP